MAKGEDYYSCKSLLSRYTSASTVIFLQIHVFMFPLLENFEHNSKVMFLRDWECTWKLALFDGYEQVGSNPGC